MILDVETIDFAYSMLKDTKEIASKKALIAADYEAVLKAEIAHFTASGEVVGSNAEQRKAFLEDKFASGYADLRMKERAAELARIQYELAQIEVGRINTIIRYMELMTADSKEASHDR